MREFLMGTLSLVTLFGAVGAVSAQSCDRACVIGITDDYLAALAARDPSAAPLADNVRFVENVTRMQPGEGLWSSLTGGPTAFQIHVPDPVAGTGGWLGMLERDGQPVMMALRLKLDANGKVEEAEHLIVNVGEQYLRNVQTPRPGLLRTIPEAQRLPREDLLRIGATYYDALDDNDGTLAPFAQDCQRHENGIPTSGADGVAGPNFNPDQAPISRECGPQLSSGSFVYIDRIEHRRMVAADPVTGLALGFSHFRHPMDNLPYTVTHTDGSTSERNKENMPYNPFDAPAAHLYKIGPEGQIHEIEAVGLSAPFNSPTGWE